MSEEARIVDVTLENLAEHPQAICFINPRQETYGLKVDWLAARFAEGLRIRLLYIPGQKRPFGFVEYVPGEACWRAVDAAGYMFIHCLWTNGKKDQHKGWGNRLIDEVEKDAADLAGVAVVTSGKSFMAGPDIFLSRGYETVAEDGKEQLLVRRFRDAPGPVLRDRAGLAAGYRDLTILYTRQCPWVARFMEEVKPVLAESGLTPEVIELTTPEEAQNAPSLYGTFNLIYRGTILADRYISVTRFRNIVAKELAKA